MPLFILVHSVLFMRSLMRRFRRETWQKTWCFFQSFFASDLALGQASATMNYRSSCQEDALTIRRFFWLSTISSKSKISWLRSKTCDRSWRLASRKRFNWPSFWMFYQRKKKRFAKIISKSVISGRQHSLPQKIAHWAELCSRSARQCRWNVGSESKVERNLFPD